MTRARAKALIPDCTTCAVCGREVMRKQGRGRPASYHPQCNKLASMLRYSETLIVEIDFDEEALRRMRGNLWAIANLLNRNEARHARADADALPDLRVRN